MAVTSAEARGGLRPKRRPWGAIVPAALFLALILGSGTSEDFVADFTNPERGLVPVRDRQYADRICRIAVAEFPVALEEVAVYVVHVKGSGLVPNVRIRRCPNRRWMMADEATANDKTARTFFRWCMAEDIAYACDMYFSAATTCTTDTAPPLVWVHTGGKRRDDASVRKTLVHELTAHCGLEVHAGNALISVLTERLVHEADYDEVLDYYEQDSVRLRHLTEMFWGDEGGDRRKLRNLRGQGLTLGQAVAVVHGEGQAAREARTTLAREAVREYMAMTIDNQAAELAGRRACTNMREEKARAANHTERVLLQAAAVMGCVWAGGMSMHEAREHWAELTRDLEASPRERA